MASRYVGRNLKSFRGMQSVDVGKQGHALVFRGFDALSDMMNVLTYGK
jgi:hypothetical protein